MRERGKAERGFSSQKVPRRWIKRIRLRRIQEVGQMLGSQQNRPPKEWEAQNPVGLSLVLAPPED